AAQYIAQMRQVQPQGPYQVAGVSMGSLLAYEIAQQVRQMNERVSLLALLDGNYVEEPINLLNVTDGHELEKELRDWQQQFILEEANRALGTAADDPDSKNLDLQVERFLKSLQGMDKIPQDITLDHFRRILNIMAINGRAANGYVPQPND